MARKRFPSTLAKRIGWVALAGVVVGSAVVLATRLRARSTKDGHAITRAVTIGRALEEVRVALTESPLGDLDDHLAIELRAAPGGRGTEMIAKLDQRTVALPALRTLVGKHPAQELGRMLARFKQQLETGGEARSDASIHAGMHAARPTHHGEETRT
ncbi:MAG TPA: hypothetical protein VG755_28420 [Nannocystaceae bacterium]|nr:hypothetical protein [Nannocystaceae bacterium]